MRILIDADGCPVVDEAIKIAKQFVLECLILCDTSHRFEREGAQTLVFSKGADSVDFALVNLLRPGDVVVTQDLWPGRHVPARSALVLNQDGMEYTADNIDSLLLARQTAKKIRNAGGRLKGPAKRTGQYPEKRTVDGGAVHTAAQDRAFSEALIELVQRRLSQG